MSFENYGLLVKHIMNLFHLISLGMGDTERHMQWAFRHLLGAEIHLQIHSVLFHRSSGCHVATFDICLTFPIHLWVGLSFFFLAHIFNINNVQTCLQYSSSWLIFLKVHPWFFMQQGSSCTLCKRFSLQYLFFLNQYSQRLLPGPEIIFH